jgi:hypothetical protein
VVSQRVLVPQRVLPLAQPQEFQVTPDGAVEMQGGMQVGVMALVAVKALAVVEVDTLLVAV